MSDIRIPQPVAASVFLTEEEIGTEETKAVADYRFALVMYNQAKDMVDLTNEDLADYDGLPRTISVEVVLTFVNRLGDLAQAAKELRQERGLL